jgi:hypothetical protein
MLDYVNAQWLDLGPNYGCDCGCDLNESEAQIPILLRVSLIGN